MARTVARASTQYFTSDSVPTTSGTMTIACWANWSGTTGGAFSYQRLLTIGHQSNDEYLISLQFNEFSKVGTYQANSSANVIINGGSITAGQWFHIAGVRNGNSSHTLYMDGSSAGTDATTATVPATLNRFRAGAYPNANYDQGYDGQLAEIAVWDAALDAAEIASLAKGYSPLLIRPGNLVYYAPFIRGTDEIDRVGGLVLTAVNTPTVSAHPRVIYPRRPRPWILGAGAPPATGPVGARVLRIPTFGRLVRCG